MKARMLTAIGLTAVLALVGCGQGTPETQGGDVTTFTSHDAIVEAAKLEGSLKVLTSFTEDAIPTILEGFKAKYPFLDVEIIEQTGDDDQRILLEIQAEQNDADVLHLSPESYKEYLPYLQQIDIAGYADSGVLDIPSGMINQDLGYVMAAGSGISAFAYNPDLLSPADAPKTWEDMLKPQFKGRKFMVDIEPTNLAALGAAWGEDKLRDYAAALKAQEPIWSRGDTVSLTAIGAGEYAMRLANNYHSAYRAIDKGASLDLVFFEPIPVRLTQIEAVRKGAAHPAAALLFLEYTASAAVQEVLDEEEPRQSSIFAEGSELNKLTDGKEVSVVDWDNFDNQPKWSQMIVETWGFPTAEVQES
jgi:iron(III) transport system substrate-binding protein